MRTALARYKVCLIHTHYRSWVHRFSCWIGDEEAVRWQTALAEAEAHARAVANRSADHENWVRLIAIQQPALVRQKDNFLTLLG
ncbi:hypothetical protein [Burkholderia sp. Ac-20365]|uniref:hypothetical protein n=1 Tax=Burkholderia sp. Ac-20365 TaxID=2703897 RepID=UPI00197C755D|nr:hypothetical protein [Burkholderia sp. Ac-20365]MBN3761116.1 hypothetical protein [Burkholderia sp. Ac-20365]